VASVQRPVLMSRLGAVTLSSSGAAANELQPDSSQAIATASTMNFMRLPSLQKCSIAECSQCLADRLRIDFLI
jgi:hypothetical protein